MSLSKGNENLQLHLLNYPFSLTYLPDEDPKLLLFSQKQAEMFMLAKFYESLNSSCV